MTLLLNPAQNPIAVPTATPTSDGAMSAADKAKLDSLTPVAPTQFSFMAKTVGAVTADVNTVTLPPNSAGLLRVTIACVCNFFSEGAFFNAEILATRNGSADGSVSTYVLETSSIDPDLAGITINPDVTLTAGVLQMHLQGIGGKTIDWTVTVQPYTATQGQ